MATSNGGRWSDLGLETDSGDRDGLEFESIEEIRSV